MVKYILFIFIMCINANGQNCKDLNQGTFEMTDKYGTIIIERKGNWQLEKSIDYGIIYLNRIEKINGCKYKLHRYKILKSGLLPISDSTSVITTTITEVEGNIFYFESTMAGVDFVMKNRLVKKSNEVSDEFIKLIKMEKQYLNSR